MAKKNRNKHRLRDSTGRFASNSTKKTDATSTKAEVSAEDLLMLLAGSDKSENITISAADGIGDPIVASDTSSDDESEDKEKGPDDLGTHESSESDDSTDSEMEDDDGSTYMLQMLTKARASSDVDDVEVFINNVDLKTINREIVKMLDGQPRTMTALLPALQKKLPRIRQICDTFSKKAEDASITGPDLQEAVLKFTSDFF